MNVQKIKYAIEVWKCGSISKAAENLFLDQANLSRVIKQLENEYNVQLFRRTHSGVEVTSEGLLFLREAEKVIDTEDSFDCMFRAIKGEHLPCKIAVPGVTYLSAAFAEVLGHRQDNTGLQLTYRETNDNLDIINCVSNLGYHIGVIRIPLEMEEAYRKILGDKHLVMREIMSFQLCVLVRENHPLTSHKTVSFDDLHDYIALMRGDDPSTDMLKKFGEGPYKIFFSSEDTITVFERGNQFEFLKNIPNTFMLVSPIPHETLRLNGLVQLPISDNRLGIFKDCLIMRQNQRFSDIGQVFIETAIKVGAEHSNVRPMMERGK